MQGDTSGFSTFFFVMKQISALLSFSFFAFNLIIVLI